MSSPPLETGLAAAIAANLADVRARMAGAAHGVGRNPASVRLIAVSKTFGAAAVLAAARAGQRDFGENKVQEGLQKMAEVAAAGVRVHWHLIGHLQSNKARKAAANYAAIHSVDSVDLLRLLDRHAADAGTRPQVLLQVDLAGEATKHGVGSQDLRPLLDACGACQALDVAGLMLLPPYLEDPDAVRPYFRQLVRLRQELIDVGYPTPWFRELSMGMSHDFEVAIEEGATMVRVGTAIFGRRPPSSSTSSTTV